MEYQAVFGLGIAKN